VDTTEFPVFQRETRSPARRAPAGSWDCQVHVFGDPRKYPPWPGRAYNAPPAHIDDMRRMHRTLGISRGLIVQPTTYGTNHSLLLDLLASEDLHRIGDH
jgi:predicted TIM-barrel fold metal-dependent hydrolase